MSNTNPFTGFQRTISGTPQTPGYFNAADFPRTPLTPVWQSSSTTTTKGGRRKGIDQRRVFQLIGVVVFALVVIGLLSATISSSDIDSSLNDKDKGPNYNYFVDYEGGLDCRIASTDLYLPPSFDDAQRKKFSYCSSRPALLDAVTGGGRHGFDEVFTPKGCHFKWYSSAEICMILDRFDGIVFVGDDSVASLYAAFNVFLRQNLAMGGLEQWAMKDKERDGCRCSNQFSRPECSKYFVKSSMDVATHDSEGGYRSPYACNRVPHFHLRVTGSPAPGDATMRFNNLLAADPHSWKPVATIHSLGLSTGFNWQVATSSMDEWLTIADASGRNTPFLWVGPNAAGHLKPPGKIMQEGNNALWHYTTQMNKEAARRGVDGIGFYNSTLQATSFDGSHYGERVSLMQAMVIINWLARLETT